MDLFEFMMEVLLVLFGSKKIWFTTELGVKSGITYVIFHNYAKIKADSYDSLPLENAVTFHNVIILTSVFS